MMSEIHAVDLIIVGGGIAGSTMALVMSRAGYSCVVLERTTTFPDRTRGEWLAPWGVLEARRIGVEAELSAARGHVIRRHVSYEPEKSREQAESEVLDLSRMVPDVEGPMTQRHPDACQTLLDAARLAGANCVRGVEDVVVTTDATMQHVAFKVDGKVHEVRGRLIVAADGRQSVVRRQLGVELHNDEPHHLFTGLLVDDADDFPDDLQVIGTTQDVHYLAFPQGSGRIRLYLGFPFSDRHRYTGEAGVRNFLAAFDTPSFPYTDAILNSTPISPHASYANEDSWVDEPFTPGVVFVGDAAGWNDPINGQGLSIALRDVRIVTEALQSTSSWSPALFMDFANERRERMSNLRFAGKVSSKLKNEFGPDAVKARVRAQARMTEQPMLGLAQAIIMIGPEHAPEGFLGPSTWDALFA
jgi:2-polyprenyl-6-methoxyphenol hydroxylase-like FAD-dependent oxidoreductase